MNIGYHSAIYIGIAAWWGFWIGMRTMPVRWRTAWLLLSGMIFLLAAWHGGKEYYEYWYPRAQVVQDTLLRAGADASYGAIGTLAAHTYVRIYALHDAWCKVDSGEQIGWVERATVKEL